MYSNSCCSSSLKHENIKIDQSSHKMYSNNILNFQMSMTILNAGTKKSGILLNAPRIIYLLKLTHIKYLSIYPNICVRVSRCVFFFLRVCVAMFFLYLFTSLSDYYSSYLSQYIYIYICRERERESWICR